MIYKVVEIRKSGREVDSKIEPSEDLDEVQTKAVSLKKTLYRNNYFSDRAIALVILDFDGNTIKRLKI